MPPRKQTDRARQGYNDYLRYTGLGLTMAGVVLAFTFLGRWLDGLIGWEWPLLTVLLALFGVVAAMVHLFKEAGRK
ncbi:MAG: AtpZ/AtpI family protein [Flavobacteriales bacterium]|jgi:hypothetical protein|nr:AtpZ/AtpI family protein [Flavobacteriales bacterium]